MTTATASVANVGAEVTFTPAKVEAAVALARVELSDALMLLAAASPTVWIRTVMSTLADVTSTMTLDASTPAAMAKREAISSLAASS
jgi:hypothetical protein